MSLAVSNLGGLDHELSDVSKQSALAKVDFSEGYGGEELREDQSDVGRGLNVRRVAVRAEESGQRNGIEAKNEGRFNAATSSPLEPKARDE